MVREDSLLTIGNWREQPLKELMEAAHSDLILNWIRYIGLKDMKRWLREKDPALQFRDRYINICDLCAEIVYSPRCQELLTGSGSERSADVIANKIATDVVVYEGGSFQYGPGEAR
jgi:hypothetical protein